MERKLATVDKILALSPIPDADAIEVAKVRGWDVVVKKGEFEVGDLCVYCEIDSVLPPAPWSEFLASRNYRIRTVKLRKQVSQGIVFSLSILPEEGGETPGFWAVGEDVTDLLGVSLYVPPAAKVPGAEVRGSFPGFIPKTDEERVQNIPWRAFNRNWSMPWTATEKLDGTSVTVYRNQGNVGVCSRNLELKLDAEVPGQAVRVVRDCGVLDWLMDGGLSMYPNIALQGELCGPGVQGNKYRLESLRWFIFGAFDIDRQCRIPLFEGSELDTALCAAELDRVPRVFIGEQMNNLTEDRFVASLVELASGVSIVGNNSKLPREGLVIRHEDPDTWFSFKVLNPDFLLKYE